MCLQTIKSYLNKKKYTCRIVLTFKVGQLTQTVFTVCVLVRDHDDVCIFSNWMFYYYVYGYYILIDVMM